MGVQACILPQLLFFRLQSIFGYIHAGIRFME